MALFIPTWQLPEGIRAAITTSAMPGNLAAHVDAEPSTVIRARRQLVEAAELPVAPHWLRQVHGTDCVHWQDSYLTRSADAIYSNQPKSVCAVLTADCLPILLCSAKGEEIAAVHAGWRGLVAGVVAQTLRQFQSARNEIKAYIGPAISQSAFEVGAEVRQQFVAAGFSPNRFASGELERYYADLPGLASDQLRQLGLTDITLSQQCTFTNPMWFSYRRDHTCGRFASLIWRSS